MSESTATAVSAAGCPFNGPSSPSAAPGGSIPPSSSTAPAHRASRPTHGPTVFYDPLSYAAYDSPYDLYRTLREKAPVYYSERRDLYVVSRYEDVQAGLKNHEQLSSALGNDMDGTHASYGEGNLIMLDDPRHAPLRSAVRRVFVGREILAKEDGLRVLARELIGELRAHGGGDFAAEVAIPLAIAAASKLIGVPEADAPGIHEHLLRSMVRVVGEHGIPDDAAASNAEAEEHLGEVFARRQEDLAHGKDVPLSEATTQIINGLTAGKVQADEQVGLAHLLLSAGIDAPAALLTNLAATLDRFPALQQHLANDRDAIPAFVEETLRFDTPGQNLCRQTTEDVVIHGVSIPRDSRVMFLLGSANRDERAFAEPDIFDIDRRPDPEHPILTFGTGIHSCMGSPMARMLGRLLVETLIDAPGLRVVGVPERWAKQMVRGFAKLPVKFDD